jgi:Holliday junction resolvasome RuvABC endonuclease subunit
MFIEQDSIMGLDPGIANFGWAYLGADGRCDSGVIIPETKDDDFTRLAGISNGILKLLGEFQPEVVVMEKMMIKVIQHQMLLVYAANQIAGMTARIYNYTNNIPLIYELNPNATKKVLGVKTKQDTKDLVKKCFRNTGRITEHEADSYGNIMAYIIETEEGDNSLYEHIKECVNANKFSKVEENHVINFDTGELDDYDVVRSAKKARAKRKSTAASKGKPKTRPTS